MDETDPSARKSVLWAGLSMLLLVPAFVAAFLVGEGLISAYGYEVSGAERPPLWAGVVATAAAIAVFALPLWPVAYFARRAVAAGAPSGRFPLIITAVVVLIFVVLNVVPMGQ